MYATCSVMLATMSRGPSGARSGSHTYSPGFRATVSGGTRTPSVKISAETIKRERRSELLRTLRKNANEKFMLPMPNNEPRDVSAVEQRRFSLGFLPISQGLHAHRAKAVEFLDLA